MKPWSYASTAAVCCNCLHLWILGFLSNAFLCSNRNGRRNNHVESLHLLYTHTMSIILLHVIVQCKCPLSPLESNRFKSSNKLRNQVPPSCGSMNQPALRWDPGKYYPPSRSTKILPGFRWIGLFFADAGLDNSPRHHDIQHPSTSLHSSFREPISYFRNSKAKSTSGIHMNSYEFIQKVQSKCLLLVVAR